MTDTVPKEADVVVVGAGPAGCVAAARLSESGRHRVVLVEAGPDMAPGAEPADVRDVYSFSAAFNRAYHWPGLQAWTRRPDVPGATPRYYEQAMMVGGGTSLNGQQATFGLPIDYDGWAAEGLSGWGWADVAPIFARLAGQGGLFPLNRVGEERWPPFTREVTAAFSAMGYQRLGDANAEFGDGWFQIATTSDGVARRSAAMVYLPAEVRARPNLTLVAGARATEIILDGARATGIRVAGPAGEARIAAGRIVLAGGAIQTPLLLQRSGIGPAEWLARAGVAVRHDLAGVGRGLQEHPSIAISGLLSARHHVGMVPRRHILAGLRRTSSHPVAGPQDLYVVIVNRAAWHAVGLRIASLFGWINKPVSRGFVRLGGNGAPDVALNLLDREEDVVRLGETLAFMHAAMRRVQGAGVVTDVVFARAGAAFRAFARRSALRALTMQAVGRAIDYVPPARRAFLNQFDDAGAVLGRLAAKDGDLAEFLRANVTPGWHPVGTCRMGPANDKAAVVDPATGSVHGIAGLHVVDASVMPSIPRANTMLPTLMVAEKLVAAIAGGLSR